MPNPHDYKRARANEPANSATYARRLLQDRKRLPKRRMLLCARSIGKTRLCKTCISGEFAYPIAMQKTAQLFRGHSLTKVIQIPLPHDLMSRILHFEE